MNVQDNLKKFPYACDKAELMKMYLGQISEKKIRESINAIIAENRDIPKGKYVYAQRIWHKELMEFVAIYGLPENYIL